MTGGGGEVRFEPNDPRGSIVRLALRPAPDGGRDAGEAVAPGEETNPDEMAEAPTPTPADAGSGEVAPDGSRPEDRTPPE